MAHKGYQTPIRPEDRFGSLPDLDAPNRQVRSAPITGHRQLGAALR
jgi:hypothetical protein